MSDNRSNAKDESCSGNSEVLFLWRNKGATRVSVSGAWCGWSEPGTPLSAEEKDGGLVFTGMVRLPRGNHKFRFVVDGEWRHDPQLPTEQNEETGELCNVVKVTRSEGKPRLQLPQKVLPKDMNSVEAADYLNSLKEYGLSTPSPKKSPGSSSRAYFGDDAAGGARCGPAVVIASLASSSASAAAAAAAGSGTEAGLAGEQQRATNAAVAGNATDMAVADAAEEPVLLGGGASTMGRAGGDSSEGSSAEGLEGSCVTEEEKDEQAAQETRMSQAMMARRRGEVESSSLAAVGACLVTSSVRKDGKLIVAMVGLPGRGKSFVARSILRHLDWIGLKSRIFSVKDRRREEVAMYEPAEYYDEGGEGEKIRTRLAAEVLGEALEALQSDIDIAIFDASNINKQRRRVLKDQVATSGLHAKVVFIECICNDEMLVRTNILAIHESSPEYEEKTEIEVERDVRSRIERYQRIYQPLVAEEGDSFIKLIDAGRQMTTNLISGYIPGRITLLCLNLHLKPRPIWMSRHGESEFNLQGRIGGDAPLTPAGKGYGVSLNEFMNKRYPPHRRRQRQQGVPAASGSASDGGCGGDGEELVVWTSTMLRTGQTVAPMTSHREVMKWSQLTEINAGIMDSLTYECVAAEMPAEYEARQKDKLRYRYPGGESYQDLFLRLEPVIFEMLRERSPLLVVGHQAILRVLYGYLTGKEPEECPTIHMPLHTVIKLTPKAYSCEEEWYRPLEEFAEPVPDVKHP